MIQFIINQKAETFAGDPQTPLLWVLRDHLHLTGTKYGCGIGQCGACTLHVNGKAKRSCITPVSSIANQSITTIEGLSAEAKHPVQRAWMELDVAQCGFCQAGQIMAAAEFIQAFPEPNDQQINQYLTNLCRCGTYVRIRKAVKRAAEIAQQEQSHATE